MVVLGKIIKTSAFYFKSSQSYTFRSAPETSPANVTHLRAELQSTKWLGQGGESHAGPLVMASCEMSLC